MIPAFNQRARAVRAAVEAGAFLRARFGDTAELIVVDDGSRPEEIPSPDELPPGTRRIALARNEGKGGAVRAGVLAAQGEYIVFTDSDLPFGLEPLTTTLAWLRAGADIVIGDRLLPESECAVPVTLLRRLSSATFTWCVHHLVGLRLPDTQCGYKGYRTAVAKPLFRALQITSFAFDVEILRRAFDAGYQVRRQPLRLVHNEDSSVRLSTHAPQMFLDTLRIAWRYRRGLYG
ncbi:MAG: glycosyltransferase [Candidatus Binatia bacterium]